MNERARAAQWLAQIASDPNRTIDRLVSRNELTPLERNLVYGVARHYFSLSAWVSGFLQKPIREKDQDVQHLLLVGAYQLQYLNVPAHAAVNETVNAVKALRKPWARALVNGVMRNLTKSDSYERSFEMPVWLRSQIEAQYEGASDLMRALNERAPMSLRINTRRTTADEYLAGLPNAHQRTWQPETIVLDAPVTQTSLPGYSEGKVAVQDAGAQCAAGLLDLPQSPAIWLDACAAPGGKLFHGLERYPLSSAHAVELSPKRAAGLAEQADRLGHTGRFDLHIGDATQPEHWWDGTLYDRILIDAPCSGTGTLRRNPDIKLHRTEAVLTQHTGLQAALLARLWPLLKPGGSLLYCTCSILRQENDAIIEQFVSTTSGARVVPLNLPTGAATPNGWQLLPTDPRTDGFFFARLEKDAT